MDSEMPYFLVWSLSSSAWCIVRYTVYPCLLSCPFYAIPISPISEIFHLLVSFHFFVFLAARVIECNTTSCVFYINNNINYNKFGSTVMHAIMIPYDTIHICMHRGS